MCRTGAMRQEAVIARSDVSVSDFNHHRLAGRVPVMDARGDAYRIILCSFGSDALARTPLIHAGLDGGMVHRNTGGQPLDDRSDAWAMAGAEQGHRQPLAKAHAHGTHGPLSTLTFNRCL